MKLQEFHQKQTSSDLIKLYESQFGVSMKNVSMHPKSIRPMLERIRESIKDYRCSPNFTGAENKPAYLKMLAMEQILAQTLREYAGTVGTTGTTGTTPVNPVELSKSVQKVKDPKVRQLLQKASRGQNLDNKESEKLAALAAGAVQESKDMPYMIHYVEEDDQWAVEDQAGNRIEQFNEKYEAEKHAFKLNKHSMRKSRATISEDEGKMHNTYSWGTSKTDDGYEWAVYGITYKEPMETMISGVEATRARAVGKAKKAVMPYRLALQKSKAPSKVSEAMRSDSKRGPVFKDRAEAEAWFAANTDSYSLVETRKPMRNISESSEVQVAQVVLAAQSLVDEVQKMIENASEAQFKDLPALSGQIKMEVGLDQARKFNSMVNDSLTELIEVLQDTKAKLESAVGVVTGEEAADIETDIDSMDMGDADADLEADEADMERAEEEMPRRPAMPAASPLGRGRR